MPTRPRVPRSAHAHRPDDSSGPVLLRPARPWPGEAPYNLPAPVTSFVGREREIAEIGRLLADTRLLTLTGPPGVGKTRLALEVATRLLGAFVDGVWLVDLAPLADPGLVPQAVAAALSVREQPGRALEATLTDAVSFRQLLLVLDNCEHLVAACATLVDRLLHTCPHLRVMATGREPLGIAGETTWRVPSLALPTMDDGRWTVANPEAIVQPALSLSKGPSSIVDRLLEHEAVRLFVERARAAQPSFTITERNAPSIGQLCRRLDGIPLALELAAARMKSLTVEQIAERLDDRFHLLTGGSRMALPRQQTLRAAVDWSYELLPDAERVLLRRLAVFAGGWTLEAAEAVCAFGAGERGRGKGERDGDESPSPFHLPLSPDEVLDLLGHLVEKSLVLAEERGAEVRYRLLETLRQYGTERLREAGEEAAVRARHLEWFAVLAERAEEPLWGPELITWFDRLKVEVDNLRAALEWSALAAARPQAEAAAVDAGLRLGGALWHFWDLRGHLSEGRLRVLELLATGAGAPATRAKAYHAAAYLTFLQGDPAEASKLVGEITALGPHSVHPFLHASALVGLALGALMAGDPARATAHCEEGLARSRQAGERRGMYYSLYGLMEVARAVGDDERAVALMEEAHALTCEQADPWSIAFALSILGNLVLRRGDAARAEALQRESLALRQAIDDAVGIGRCLDGLGWAAGAQGQSARAARLFGAAEVFRERVGAAPHPPWRAEHEQRVAATRAGLGEAAFAAAWAEGRALSLDEAIAYALAPEEPAPASDTLPARPSPRVGPGGLSPRELEVALLIAQGNTNRRIAEALAIGAWTVDTHVRHIMTKLGFRTRAKVAAWATEQELDAPSQ